LPILVEQADIAAYMLRGVRDGSPAVERFLRLRGAGDAAALPPQAPRGGLLGRVSGVLGTGASARRPVAAIRPGDRQIVPFAIRDQLLKLLRSVRCLCT